MDKKINKTSWEPANKWYKSIVGQEGHYYHQKIVLPGILNLLNIPKDKEVKLLDLACGNGVLSRHLGSKVEYKGLDISSSFIAEAKKMNKYSNHEFFVADATHKLPLKDQDFDMGTIVLALQNIQSPLKVFQNFSNCLKKGGKLVIVINHPCFRIPRQSSWQIDKEKKIQYRRVDAYSSAMELPLLANPSLGEKSKKLYSYHFPLSSYFTWLKEANFCVEDLQEWHSDKTSEGGAAKMENKARNEFPLFMAIVAKKL